MQRNDIPDTAATSGLSTDDLARPRDTPTRESAASTPAATPTFPGESTATPSRPASDEATVPSAGREEEAQADSGTQQQDTNQNGHTDDEATQLLTAKNEEGFRTRWQDVQNKFVDDPREAVRTADALVADVMQQLAATFANHYRAFFNRLLTT